LPNESVCHAMLSISPGALRATRSIGFTAACAVSEDPCLDRVVSALASKKRSSAGSSRWFVVPLRGAVGRASR